VAGEDLRVRGAGGQVAVGVDEQERPGTAARQRGQSVDVDAVRGVDGGPRADAEDAPVGAAQQAEQAYRQR
jgi:hypothetical protein